MTEIKFDEALKKLEGIISDLESGELSLEKSLKKYEEGIKLSRLCTRKLEDAQKKIEILTRTSDGKLKLAPFEEKKEEEPRKRTQKSAKSEKKDEEMLF